jgi:Outer membrane lipoprotein carrier protein LolA
MKTSLILVGIAFSIVLSAGPDAARADEKNPLIAQIQTMLAKPTTLCGRFDQTKQLNGMKKPLLSNGRFCVVNGKGVVWRTLQPFPSTLRLTRDEIVNYQGDKVAMRLDANQEPTVRMINNVLFSLLGGDLGQLDSLFVVDGKATATSWHASLTARQPSLAKAIGAITLDGAAYVNTIHMDEASGDHTTIVFSAMQTGDKAMQPEETALFQ